MIEQANKAGWREHELLVKTIFTQLVNSAYFDTPLVDVSLRSEPLVWQYMVKVTELVQAVGADDEHPARHFIRDAGVPMIDSFFKFIYQDQGFSEEIGQMKELLATNLERLINDAMLDTAIRPSVPHASRVAADRYGLDERRSRCSARTGRPSRSAAKVVVVAASLGAGVDIVQATALLQALWGGADGSWADRELGRQHRDGPARQGHRERRRRDRPEQRRVARKALGRGGRDGRPPADGKIRSRCSRTAIDTSPSTSTATSTRASTRSASTRPCSR